VSISQSDDVVHLTHCVTSFLLSCTAMSNSIARFIFSVITLLPIIITDRKPAIPLLPPVVTRTLDVDTSCICFLSFEAFYFQFSFIYYCNSERIANVCILRLRLQFPSRCCSDSSFFTAAGRLYGGSFLACIQASCFFGNRPFVLCPLYISLNFVTQGRTILNFLVFRVTNLRFSLHHRARRRYRASRLMVQ
jgi:hypothetical protein